jgi:hypothetical protein
VKELTIHSFLALQISITILAQLLGTKNQHHNPCTASWHNNSALQSVHSFLLGTANQQSLHSMDPSSDLAQNLSYNVSPVHITKADAHLKAAAATME